MKSDNILHWGMINAILLVVGKVASVISQLYVSKILSPVEFANANLAISILSIFVNFSSVSMIDAVPTMGRYRFDALQYIFPLAVLINSILMIFLILSSFIFSSIYHSKELIYLIIVSSISLPLIAISTRPTCEQKLTLKFKRITFSTFIVNISSSVISIILVIMGFSSISLILPLVVCQIIQIMIIYTPSNHGYKISDNKIIIFKKLIGTTSFYWLINFLISIQLALPMLILGTKLDKNTLGYLIWGILLATQFSYVASNSLRGMYMPKISSIYSDNPKAGDDSIINLSMSLHAVFFPIILFQMLWLPRIIPFVFSNKWNSSIDIIEYMSAGQLLLCWNAISFCLFSARAEYTRLLVLLLIQGILIIIASVMSIVRPLSLDCLISSSFLIGGLMAMGFSVHRLKQYFKIIVNHLRISLTAGFLIIPIFFFKSICIAIIATLISSILYIIINKKYFHSINGKI